MNEFEIRGTRDGECGEMTHSLLIILSGIWQERIQRLFLLIF